jgi:chromosome segregation ATPase
MKSSQKLVLGILLAFTLALQPAVAADKKDKAAREAQRRMALIKQQMEAEKAELQAGFDKEKAELQGKVLESEKASDQLRGSVSSAKRRNSELSAELETLRKEKLEVETAKAKIEAELIQTRGTLDSTSKTLADTQNTLLVSQRDLKANEAQRKEIAKSLVQRDQWIGACSEKNSKLHAFGLDLIKVYDKPSTYEAVLRTEQFSQLKRVELENLLQDYRDKLDEQKVVAAPAK